MPDDPTQGVLRDFENVIWLTLLCGLALFGVWRYFFQSSRAGKRAVDSVGGGPPQQLGADGVFPSLPAPEPPSSPEKGLPVAHFTWADLFILPLVLIKYSVTLQLLAGSLSFASGGVSDSAKPDTGEMSPSLIVLDLTINIFLIILVVLMVQWVGRRKVREVFGLSRFQFPRKLLWFFVWVVGGALIATPAVILTSNFMPELFAPFFGEGLAEQAAVQSMRGSSDLILKVLLVIQACLVAPVVEELIFRGYFYGIMKRFTCAMFAAFVTSAIFAVAHQSILALLPLWGLALILTFFYEASRSLWVPIGIHVLFNAVNVALILTGMGGGPE